MGVREGALLLTVAPAWAGVSSTVRMIEASNGR
jgi:hypothetical protein